MQSDRWIGSELARCKFKDERHGKRLRKLLEQLSDKIGGSIPLACQDWANTKAAYRFFENEKVMGDSVNVASRIQSLGQANTILFSKELFDKIKKDEEGNKS